VLVAFALVSLSPTTAANFDTAAATTAIPASGKAIAGACLTAAALIVLYGLYVIIAA
jgi:hypothetical protein